MSAETDCGPIEALFAGLGAALRSNHVALDRPTLFVSPRNYPICKAHAPAEWDVRIVRPIPTRSQKRRAPRPR